MSYRVWVSNIKGGNMMKEGMKTLILTAVFVTCCLALPTWESIGPDGGGPLRGVAIAPSNENIVYTMSRERSWPYHTPRFFRSTDGGNTWTFRGIITDSLICYSIAVDPSDPDIVYVSSRKAIFKSIDAGMTWSVYTVTANLDTIPDIKVSPSSSQTVYATGRVQASMPSNRFGFFKSIDGGATWQAETLSTVPGVSQDIAIAPTDHNMIYICGQVQNKPRVFRSLDNGATFTNITNNLADSANVLYNVWSAAVHETIPDYVYIGTHKSIWRTTDGGATWSEALLCSLMVWDIETSADDPSVLYAVTDSFVYKSIDAGTTWTVTGPGYEPQLMNTTRTPRLAAKDSDADYVFATNSGNHGMFRTTNGGVSWDTATTGLCLGDISACNASKSSPSIMYTQRFWVAIHKSTDYGSTWIELEDWTDGCLGLCDFAFHNTSADTILTLEGES